MKLKTILGPVAKEHELVRQEISQQLAVILSKHTGEKWSEGYVTRVMQHIFNIPGKMLRPALFLLAARSVSPDEESYLERTGALVQLAAGIEILHTASLIHDDIIDEADTRRTQHSLNAEYGVKIAVLIGDILFAQFFSIVLNLPVKDPSLKSDLLSIFSNLTQAMCFGEVFQQKLLSVRRDAEFSEYLTILEKKTALLMEASCRSGAMIAGGTQEQIRSVSEFGLNFGYAFQLADDLADEDGVYTRTPEIMAEASSRIASAKACLKGFEDTPSTLSLNSLCDYLETE